MKWRKTAVRKLLAALLASAMAVSLPPSVSYAATTQEKINQAEQEKDQLEDQLEDKQDELSDLKGEQNSLKGQLNKLNAELTQVSNNLADLEQQILAKEQEIVETQAALEEARQTEAWQYQNLKSIIRYMYESNEKSYLQAFFESDSLADFLNAADLFERVAEYARIKLEEFEANRMFIESEEERLHQENQQLNDLKAQAEAERDKVSGLIGETSDAISDYADQISDAEAQALAYEAQIKEKEEDLEYLRKKLAEEIALSQAAANAKWRDISEVSFSDSDVKLLANLIYCEAGAEPYEGQLAVGAVVINRVLSSKFPDTVVGVIYQSRQFSPVGSGRLELALASDKATDRCYQAAREAISGMSNVGNCVFFRTPIPGLTGISIGGHIFY